MQAVVFERIGEPAEVLELRDVPVPQPARGEVRVRMLASPVNPSDLLEIRGRYSARPTLPAVPGHEGVGVVEASGGGLLGTFLVGKRVAVLNRSTGNWCEQTVIPARQAIPLPADLPLEQAAMFFINPATAYVMTRRVLNVPRGEWLLQTAAGSALGRMVIRLGRRYGFRTINVVRRAEQAEALRALGADVVVPFDPESQPAEELQGIVREVVRGDGVKFAIEPVGGATGSAAAACLGEGARMLVYGTLANEPLAVPARRLIETGATIEGFFLKRWGMHHGLVVRLRLVRTIVKLMRAGVLVSPVGEVFPLERVIDAVRQSEIPGRGGKVLLRIAEPA
jgi:NADPH:quinone reductase-like Zn-dependent oxidoreductase